MRILVKLLTAGVLAAALTSGTAQALTVTQTGVTGNCVSTAPVGRPAG